MDFLRFFRENQQKVKIQVQTAQTVWRVECGVRSWKPPPFHAPRHTKSSVENEAENHRHCFIAPDIPWRHGTHSPLLPQILPVGHDKKQFLPDKWQVCVYRLVSVSCRSLARPFHPAIGRFRSTLLHSYSFLFFSFLLFSSLWDNADRNGGFCYRNGGFWYRNSLRLHAEQTAGIRYLSGSLFLCGMDSLNGHRLMVWPDIRITAVCALYAWISDSSRSPCVVRDTYASWQENLSTWFYIRTTAKHLSHKVFSSILPE